MTTFIIKLVDSSIGNQIAVVEEQTVDTQTISQLELIVDVPVILDIETRTVELHTGSGLRLTIITVGQTEDLWCLVEEFLNTHTILPVVTVVTCTITHILVVGHLMLEGDTCHNLVSTKIVGHIILKVPNRIVYSIVPGKQLIAKRHIVVAVLCDINEGELG